MGAVPRHHSARSASAPRMPRRPRQARRHRRGPATPIASPVASPPRRRHQSLRRSGSAARRRAGSASGLHGQASSRRHAHVGPDWRGQHDFNPASFAQDFQIPVSYLEPLVWIDGCHPGATALAGHRMGSGTTNTPRSPTASGRASTGMTTSGFTASDVVFSFYGLPG